MHRIKTRVIAVLAAFFMVAMLSGTLPTVVYADDWPVSTSAELVVALTECNDGDTIVLAANVTLSDSDWGDDTIIIDNEIVIDTQGYDLILTSLGITVNSSGNLSIINGGDLEVSRFDVIGGALFIDTANVLVRGSPFDYGMLYVEGSTASVTIDASLMAANGGDGVQAYAGSTVVVNGNINASNTGVIAGSGAFVEVYGSVSGLSADGNGVEAYSGANIYIDGDVVGDWRGVYAEGTSTRVTVVGGITSNYDGIEATGDATVIVTGSITASVNGADIRDGASVTINGDIIGSNLGVYAEGAGSAVILYGDIDTDRGVEAWNGASVTVFGSIKATLCGILAGWSEVEQGGATVTVYGTITVDADGDYIELIANETDDIRGSDDDDGFFDYAGNRYLVYSDGDNAVYIWLSTLEDEIPQEPETPETGDAYSLLLVTTVLVFTTSGACVLAYCRRRKECFS